MLRFLSVLILGTSVRRTVLRCEFLFSERHTFGKVDKMYHPGDAEGTVRNRWFGEGASSCGKKSEKQKTTKFDYAV